MIALYLSSPTVDRVGGVLDPAGCWYKHYAKNPVVLWAHDYSQPPIGKSEWLETDSRGIKSKTVYANTPRGEEVWQLVKGGFINTSSVGFVALERVYKGRAGWSQAVDKYNALWNMNLEKDGCEIITTKWALLEYSDVPVPCNPDALVVAVAKGMSLSSGTLKQLGIDPVTMKTDLPKPKGIIEIISDQRDNRPILISATTKKQSSAIEVIETKRPDMTDHQLLNWRSPPI